jgi:hypothetical protein
VVESVLGGVGGFGDDDAGRWASGDVVSLRPRSRPTSRRMRGESKGGGSLLAACRLTPSSFRWRRDEVGGSNDGVGSPESHRERIGFCQLWWGPYTPTSEKPNARVSPLGEPDLDSPVEGRTE